jgi:isoleucyl-tRNA synthetase
MDAGSKLPFSMCFARFLLANLNGFDAADALPYDQLMPLDKYMLHTVHAYQGTIKNEWTGFF